MECGEREPFVMATLHLVFKYLCLGTVVKIEGKDPNREKECR